MLHATLLEKPSTARSTVSSSARRRPRTGRQRTAVDGLEALDMLARERPDLLLVDFAMPGMKGADVIRNACDIHADQPVVMATADVKAVEKVRPSNECSANHSHAPISCVPWSPP